MTDGTSTLTDAFKVNTVALDKETPFDPVTIDTGDACTSAETVNIQYAQETTTGGSTYGTYSIKVKIAVGAA